MTAQIALTDQQLQIAFAEHSLKAQAFAGSGKTTSFYEYIKNHPRERILYVCYNKLNKEHFSLKCHEAGFSNVTVSTIHQVAKVSVYGHEKISICNNHDFGRIRELFIDKMHGIPIQDQAIVLFRAQDLVRKYCYSSNTKLTDFDYIKTLNPEIAFEIKPYLETIYGFAKRLMEEMFYLRLPVIHDFYVKLFQTKNKQLAYDTILLDEVQDMNDCMLAAFATQKMKIIAVGDMHQEIYGWRGAKNTLDKLYLPITYLSDSFRFSNTIAEFASKILNWKDTILKSNPTPIAIKGRGPNPMIRHTAHLTRSTVTLIHAALKHINTHKKSKCVFQGGLKSYLSTDNGLDIQDIFNFYYGTDHNNRFLDTFPSYESFHQYALNIDDHSLLGLISLVEEYGKNLTALINQLKRCEIGINDKAIQPDLVFSTVHRIKGLEFEEVILDTDFHGPEELIRMKRKKERSSEQLTEDINSIYVAVTRASRLIKVDEKLLA